MNKYKNYTKSRTIILKLVNSFLFISFFILLISVQPVLADPFAEIFNDPSYLSESDIANYTGANSGPSEYVSFNSIFNKKTPLARLPKNTDVFDSAIKSYTDVDTSSVDLLIAKFENQDQKQAFNSEVVWEIDAELESSKTKDRSQSVTDKLNNGILKTSVSLRKTLWDKTLKFSIDSARNNIKTAEINHFESENQLIESVALAYLDYLAAKDLVASAQRGSQLFLNIKNKINESKGSDDNTEIDMEEIEDQIQTAQNSLLDEKNNLEKSKIKLRQLTNTNNININYSSNEPYFTGNNDIGLSSDLNLIRAAMENNMELKALYSNGVSLQKNILSKRSEKLPKLNFTSSISQEWSTGDTDLDTLDASMGLNMEMPLYTGGRVNNQVKLAKLELLSNERLISQKKREIIAEISTLSSEFYGLLSSYRSVLKLHNKVKKKIKPINAAIASNKIESTDMLEELDNEIELNSSLIRQYYSLLKIKVEIMKITGDLNMFNLNKIRSLLLIRK